jgi:tetratricopeptide (TPR) repeat protein
MGLPFYFSHQYDQAIAQFRKVIEMDPKLSSRVHYWLGLAYTQKGMYQEAVTEFLQARTLSADRPENISALREALAAFQVGEASWQRGR